MRILATLILAATLISAVPAIAADTNDANQNGTQKLETKKTISLNDNFLIAASAPLASSKNPKQSLFRSYILAKGSFIINASAYTAAADECGKSDGITASGAQVTEGRTLACPPSYKFGTKVKIDGMGIYVCEDRGGAIKGNHFDIYMQTKQQAFAFGRRNLVAMVVE